MSLESRKHPPNIQWSTRCEGPNQMSKKKENNLYATPPSYAKNQLSCEISWCMYVHHQIEVESQISGALGRGIERQNEKAAFVVTLIGRQRRADPKSGASSSSGKYTMDAPSSVCLVSKTVADTENCQGHNTSPQSVHPHGVERCNRNQIS